MIQVRKIRVFGLRVSGFRVLGVKCLGLTVSGVLGFRVGVFLSKRHAVRCLEHRLSPSSAKPGTKTN